MELDVRLNILKDAGQISEETFEALKRVIDIFRNKYGIVLTEENGAMLITHLSVAFERIKKGEIIEGIESEIYNEIRNHQEFNKAKEMIGQIMGVANTEIPESEETFIMMHLCTLLQENK
jgi:transcriptional antiterminator